jgi:hypothetical protein
MMNLTSSLEKPMVQALVGPGEEKPEGCSKKAKKGELGKDRNESEEADEEEESEEEEETSGNQPTPMLL